MKPDEEPQSNNPAASEVLATSGSPGGRSKLPSNVLAALLTRWPGRGWLLGALLVAATFVAYLPVWRAGFIWDDDTFLLGNPLIQRADGLWRLWFTTASQDYFPLTSTTLWFEWRLWGPNPLGYHLVNVLLHALSAVLLWRVLKGLKIPGGALAAAIFAVHPVNVESVAWITERKNTLCMFFYLLSVLLYLRSCGMGRLEPPGVEASDLEATAGRSTLASSLFYWLALGAFALALLSKTAGAPLPLVLLGLAWWRCGRIKLGDVWRSLPFFVLAAGMGLISLWFQYHRAIGASMLDVRNDGFWSRLAGAGWAVWFYLYKALLPLHLSFVYPRWQIDPSRALAYVPGVLLVACFVICWCYRRRWGKALLCGLGYFVLLLLPVLGFLNIYFMRYSLVSDHWQYFAIIGPIALVAAGIALALAHTKTSVPYAIFSGAFVVALGALTWRQAGSYRNLETLWTATLAQNPRASIAHNNLGNLLLQRGQVKEAIAHFQQALAIQPNASDVHCNLGSALLVQGRAAEAVAHFKEALRIQPTSAQAHINLGNVLLQQGQVNEALAHFQKAVELQPGQASAFYSLGSALLQAGRTEEAVAQFQRALELQPNLASAHMNLGNALLSKRQLNEAIIQFRQAAELEPGLATAHHNLGNALLQAGQVDEAITQFRAALAIQPDFAGAHNGLANALLGKGQADEAITEFQKALRLQPDFAEAHLNLANLLLQSDRVDEAIPHFRKALQLQPNLVDAHNNLANALLRKGQVDEAITHYERALSLEPNLAEAHNNLANALLQKGRPAEAVTHYRAAIAARPDNPYLLNNLAWVLATSPQASVRNGARAVELAQQAEHLSGGKDPGLLGTLAAAYAEAGRFKEAVATAQRALELATAQTNTAQIETLRARLSVFQAGTPFRDPGLPPRVK